VKLIQGGRGSGKTTELVDWWLDDQEHRGIVTDCHQSAEQLASRVYVRAEEKAIEVDNLHLFGNIVSVHRAQRIRGRNSNMTWAVDELEMVLHAMLGVPIEQATLNNHNEIWVL